MRPRRETRRSGDAEDSSPGADGVAPPEVVHEDAGAVGSPRGGLGLDRSVAQGLRGEGRRGESRAEEAAGALSEVGRSGGEQVEHDQDVPPQHEVGESSCMRGFRRTIPGHRDHTRESVPAVPAVRLPTCNRSTVESRRRRQESTRPSQGRCVQGRHNPASRCAVPASREGSKVDSCCSPRRRRPAQRRNLARMARMFANLTACFMRVEAYGRPTRQTGPGSGVLANGGWTRCSRWRAAKG